LIPVHLKIFKCKQQPWYFFIGMASICLLLDDSNIINLKFSESLASIVKRGLIFFSTFNYSFFSDYDQWRGIISL